MIDKRILAAVISVLVLFSIIMAGRHLLHRGPERLAVENPGPVPAGAGEEYTHWLDDLGEDEVLVVGNESMPFCGLETGKDVGMAVDILNAITAAGGPRFRFKLGLPWKRAQRMVHQAAGARVAIVPLTRTPTREDQFLWIAEIIPHALHLHTVGKPAPLQTIEEAKDLETGIIRGSAMIPLLQQLGFSRISETLNAKANARMLVKGRIDVMAESQWVNTYVRRTIGQDPGELQVGPAVGDTHYIYLGGGLDFPAPVAKRIQDAMREVRNSGKLKEIYAKWRM